MNQCKRSLAITILVTASCAALVACGSGSGDAPSSEAFAREQIEKRHRVRAPAPAPTDATPVPIIVTGRWQPSVKDSWHLQLTNTVGTSQEAAIYDIDLFDTPARTISAVKSLGRRVVCYFSAGTSENWRPDFSMFSASDMGNSLADWPGERWLDTRSDNVRQLMKRRLDLAVSKGCDGVDPDNVDGYTNKPGFPLDQESQLQYNRFLAQEAHARGLAVGLKNDVDQLAQLAPDFDFAINEQCAQYNECDGYRAFIGNGKPVLQVEYASKYRDNLNGARDTLCAASRAADRRTLVLSMQLDGSFRFSCD